MASSTRSRFPLPSLCFTKLADLSKKENQTLNIFGIVKFFKSPVKSRGKDFCLTLSLVDDSFQNTENSFVCNVFSPHEDQLPLVRSVGDIVKLIGIKVSSFRGQPQGKGTSSMSWVTFDGYSSIDSIQHIASSIPNYTTNDQDKQIIKDLKTWASSFESIRPQSYKKTLSQLHSDVVFFNIFCQVVSICQAVNCNCVILTVWDGGTLNCKSHSLEEPLSSTLQVKETLKKDAEGMTIDVFLYDEHATGEVKNVKPGDFVMLSNVHAQPEKDTTKEGYPKISFVIHKGRINGRGVFKLQQDSQFVKEVLEQIESFKSNKSVCNNQTTTNTRALETSCTITDFPLIPFTTIKDIKKCPKVPNKFRCRVKAIAFLPNDVKDFVQMYCPSCRKVTLPKEPKEDEDCARKLSESDFDSMDSRSECSQDEQAQDMIDKSGENQGDSTLNKKCVVCDIEMSFVYVLSLLIEDTTGMLHVMLFNEDAQLFLPDLPSPESFLVNSEIQQSIRDTLTSTTGNLTNELDAESQPSGARSWMECCVFSYHVQEHGVLYRIFGTTVV